MNILVTGGSGYIGSHTCVELLNAGYDVVSVDNYANSSPKALERVETITGKRVKAYECDLREEDKLNSIFNQNKIDAVIHFAGLKAVGESVSKPMMYYQNNLGGLFSLYEAMKKHDVKKFVFSSSATVYGEPEKVPMTEDMPTGGVTNPYGRTKYMIEEILKDINRAEKGWSIMLLRYFNPIGAHESGLIGEDPSGEPNNLLPYVTQVAIGRRPKLRVFGNDYPTPDGTCIRDYIHVVDLAIGHIKAIDWVCRNEGIEAVNLGTGKGSSVLEVITAFERANGIKINYEIASRRSGDIPQCYADPAKALKILNWKAQFDLERMCADAWRWQSNNPTGFNQ